MSNEIPIKYQRNYFDVREMHLELNGFPKELYTITFTDKEPRQEEDSPIEGNKTVSVSNNSL